MSSDDVSETEMSQPLASGGLMSLTSAASAWWVSGVRGEGEFGSVLRQSHSAVLVLLVGFTACDLSIDSPGASINHRIKLLFQ